MKILFAGTPDVALPAFRALLESHHDVLAVITRPDARKGRGRTMVRSDVGQAADDAGIPVLTPRTLRDAAVQEEIRALGAEAAAVVAYGGLIPQELLDDMPWVNLHFSLLPRWRGAAPVQHAIAAGDTVTGANTFLLEAGLDTGPIIREIRRPIAPHETAGDVLDDLAVTGAPLLVESLDALENGTANTQPQPAEGITLAPKITVADAQIDWDLDAAVIDRTIRSVSPFPGAWTTLDGQTRVKIGPVTLAGTSELKPGELQILKQEVRVGSGGGDVILGQVAPASKGWMDAAAWGRGLRDEHTFEVKRG